MNAHQATGTSLRVGLSPTLARDWESGKDLVSLSNSSVFKNRLDFEQEWIGMACSGSDVIVHGILRLAGGFVEM